MHLSSIQTAKVLLNFENQEAKSGTKLEFFETKSNMFIEILLRCYQRIIVTVTLSIFNLINFIVHTSNKVCFSINDDSVFKCKMNISRE